MLMKTNVNKNKALLQWNLLREKIQKSDVKIDFIKVKKEKDDRVKSSSAKVQGSPREETQKVSGDKGTS